MLEQLYGYHGKSRTSCCLECEGKQKAIKEKPSETVKQSCVERQAKRERRKEMGIMGCFSVHPVHAGPGDKTVAEFLPRRSWGR